MFNITPKLKDLTPYQPVEGHYQVRLDANESFLDLPDEIKNQITLRIGDVSANRYPDPSAADLCKAFANFYSIDPSLVTAGNGSDELISLLVNCFVGRGETLLTLDPDFSMYPFYAFLAETNHITLPKHPDLSLSADEIIEALNRYKPRMLLFSNPCNPSSLGWTREEICRILQSTDALVVLDEAYMDFWDQSLLNQVAEFENLMILKTLSKMGLAAFRLGFAIANPRLTSLLKAVKSPYNLNALSQAAGVAVIQNPRFLRDAIAQITKQKESLLLELTLLSNRFPDKFQVLDSKANFITLLTKSPATLRQKLREQSVSIALPLGRYARITAGNTQENAAFLSAFKAIIGQL